MNMTIETGMCLMYKVYHCLMYYLGLALEEVISLVIQMSFHIECAWMDVTIQIHSPILNRRWFLVSLMFQGITFGSEILLKKMEFKIQQIIYIDYDYDIKKWQICHD